jgi:uncharacterized membrane protein
MNTIFKFFNAQWIILGTATFIAFRLAIKECLATEPPIRDRIGWLFSVPVLTILVGFIGSFGAVVAMTTFHRVPGHRPALDGTDFLLTTNPVDKRIISFLNSNITSPLPILEAYGQSYAAYTRISMYTGLPTLLGWDHHVRQRGLADAEVERRKGVIKSIYTTKNAHYAHSQLMQEKIALVVVGELERANYPDKGTEKFAGNPDLFKALYQDNQYGVYEVVRK